jgi:hypothetical protein
MDTPGTLRLPSGLQVGRPLERLQAFCVEEYAYYDAVPSGDPDRIEPLDILVTVSMNAFVNTADRVRSVHRGLVLNCEPSLPEIPEAADLREFDLAVVERLLEAACRVRWVLIPVATKVLHRKRRSLIPMLDGIVINYYRSAGVAVSEAAMEVGSRAAEAAMPLLEAFRSDLEAAWGELEALAASLAEAGFRLTPLRLMELLVWTEMEPRGYYRARG